MLLWVLFRMSWPLGTDLFGHVIFVFSQKDPVSGPCWSGSCFRGGLVFLSGNDVEASCRSVWKQWDPQPFSWGQKGRMNTCGKEEIPKL